MERYYDDERRCNAMVMRPSPWVAAAGHACFVAPPRRIVPLIRGRRCASQA